MIIVYTTSNCPRCRLLKEWLKSKGVVFEEKSLDASEVMADLIVRNIYVLSAPALEVGGKVYSENELFQSEKLNEEFLEEIIKNE
jgi:glutaredoxin